MTGNFAQVIESLTQEQQETVREFIGFLKEREAARSPFLNAVDEFIERHPALLSSLAQ